MMHPKYPIGTLVLSRISGIGVITDIRDDNDYFVNWTQIGGRTIYKESYIDAIVGNYKIACEEG